jgi:hypothetical protein
MRNGEGNCERLGWCISAAGAFRPQVGGKQTQTPEAKPTLAEVPAPRFRPWLVPLPGSSWNSNESVRAICASKHLNR